MRGLTLTRWLVSGSADFENFRMGGCLMHLYPPITRKRRWRYALDDFRASLGVDHF